MSGTDILEAAMVEAPPLVRPETVPAATAQLLDGGEIIEFSIKPSWGYIPVVSAPWVLATLLPAMALVIAVRGNWTQAGVSGVLLLAALAGVRVALAVLQWANQLYVLTNRRVLRFRGVFNVDVAECPLARISQIDLHMTWYQRLLRLGSISMKPASSPATTAADKPVVSTPAMLWEHIAHPAEEYQTLMRAIRRSQ